MDDVYLLQQKNKTRRIKVKKIDSKEACKRLMNGERVYWDEEGDDFFQIKHGCLLYFSFPDDNYPDDDTEDNWRIVNKGERLFIKEVDIKEEPMRQVTKEEARQHLRAGGKVVWDSQGTESTLKLCGDDVKVNNDWNLAGGLNMSVGENELFIKEEKEMNRQEAFEALVDGKKVEVRGGFSGVGTLWQEDDFSSTELKGEFSKSNGGTMGEGATISPWYVWTKATSFCLQEEPKEEPKDKILCEVLDVLEGDDGCKSDSRKIKDAKDIIKKHI